MKKYIYLSLVILLGACTTTNNAQDFEQPCETTPFYNEQSAGLMGPHNQYANIDSLRPKTPEEAAHMDSKWNTSRKETTWQEYHGTMVRIEVLLGSDDLREMRLRLIQNANGMDVDGDFRSVLDKVSEFEMKRVCGRNSTSYVIVYDKPSFEVLRPTPYFDYRIQDDGVNMREYGFRCIYNN
ncbi:MAG: hypothetical protein ACOX7D_01290 [Alphaproteobacteria bacterium]|jgi:hypothetical protein